MLPLATQIQALYRDYRSSASPICPRRYPDDARARMAEVDAATSSVHRRRHHAIRSVPGRSRAADVRVGTQLGLQPANARLSAAARCGRRSAAVARVLPAWPGSGKSTLSGAIARVSRLAIPVRRVRCRHVFGRGRAAVPAPGPLKNASIDVMRAFEPRGFIGRCSQRRAKATSRTSASRPKACGADPIGARRRDRVSRLSVRRRRSRSAQLEKRPHS